jgi:hypothetical protein
MPIITKEGPGDASEVIGRALQHLSAASAPAALTLRQATAPKVTKPMRVYTVAVDEIISTDFLRMARPIGWRYLVVGGDPDARAVAAADLRDAKGGSTFGSLFHGPVPERLAEAAEVAQAKYGADPGSYEIRILELPSLYLSALWLVGPNDTNRFIPYLDGNQPTPIQIREDSEFPAKTLAAANRKRQVKAQDSDLSN